MEQIGIELIASTEKAVAKIKGGVDKIGAQIIGLNKKKVDWTSILAGAF